MKWLLNTIYLSANAIIEWIVWNVSRKREQRWIKCETVNIDSFTYISRQCCIHLSINELSFEIASLLMWDSKCLNIPFCIVFLFICRWNDIYPAHLCKKKKKCDCAWSKKNCFWIALCQFSRIDHRSITFLSVKTGFCLSTKQWSLQNTNHFWLDWQCIKWLTFYVWNFPLNLTSAHRTLRIENVLLKQHYEVKNEKH